MNCTNISYLALCVLFLVAATQWTTADCNPVKPVFLDSENGVKGHLYLRHQDATTHERRLEDPIAIRLNAGGPAFVDKDGNSWESDDAYANTGRTYKTSQAIEDTPNENQVLYQYERWDPLKGKRLKYSFDLPNGSYQVKLHFVEAYVNSTRDRVFDVWIQGAKVYEDLDILQWTGAKYRPLVLTHVAQVEDGELVITFQHKIQNTKVNGIEILSTSNPSPGPTCTRHVVDFSQTPLGDELSAGRYVAFQWKKFGMYLSSSGGELPRPRLYNTSDANGLDPDLGSPNMRCTPPGPGIGLGGEPDMEGENCQAQGLALIIQEPEETGPSDNKDGGSISFHFPDLANVEEIGLLDIDYEAFITVIVKNKGVGYRKLPVINVQPLGDNSFQTVSINVKRVKRIDLNLARSGAVTSISFCGKALSEYDQCIRDCPSKYCVYESPEDLSFLTCAVCHEGTNAGCSDNSICKSKYNTDSSINPPSCYLRAGESCSSGRDCASEVCDPKTMTCSECAPSFIDPTYGERETNWGCVSHREACARIDGTHKCLRDVIDYSVSVEYIDQEEIFTIRSIDAQDAIDDCENNRTVILKNIFNAPVALCPGLSTTREGDGFMGWGDLYNFYMTSNENVTMNCTGVTESYRRCRVVYRFPLLGSGEDCTRSSQCQSNDCCDECRNDITGADTCK